MPPALSPSPQKAFSRTNYVFGTITRAGFGFSLIEVILSGALFFIFGSVVITSLLYSQTILLNSKHRTQAVFLADEALEAVRNLRDRGVTLSAGTFGLSRSGGQWNFDGNSEAVGIFIREITLSPIEDGTVQIQATISWLENESAKNFTTATYVTSWR